ncbi:RHS repeat domain-containing protein, partial [Sphingomonas sp. Leaf33]|uniref:RHS repeat domain-containing protein n=1 Tax=Sphingomonas sp. Leaf33 TaxID=1736215 RepID=UPI0012E31AC1
MVSIFTGAGTGFERGSGNVLGGAGLLGSGVMGQTGEQVTLNAANGNLVISRQDEYLVGRGPDAAVSRTYNSLGDLCDDNGDNWRQSTQRRIFDLIGQANTWGSSVKRIAGDGSRSTYTFDGVSYVGTDGAGSYDRITYDGSWRWTDGDSRVVEIYNGPNNHISQLTDTNGNTLMYAYAGDKLIDVTTANGERIHYTWSGNNLAEITTIYNDGGTWRQLTRVRYEYDGYNRLANVAVDLTPEDNGTWDGNRYLTSYTYHGASKLVASITQTDGSRLDIGYDANNRVTGLSQTAVDGVVRTTSIGYGAGYTNVTDPQGQTTALSFDGAGQLVQITTPPPANGEPAQTLAFSYNGRGDVVETRDGAGAITHFAYDERGNLIAKSDPDGTVTVRTYDAGNRVLTETIDANRVHFAAMQAGSTGWNYGYDPNNIRATGVPDAGYRAGGAFVKGYFNATAPGQVISISTGGADWFDVAGGERLAVQTGVEANGSIEHMDVSVHFLDAAGNYVGGAHIGTVYGPQSYNTKVGNFVGVPASAVRARLEVYCYSSEAGSGNFLMVQPSVTTAAPGQTTFPSFGSVREGTRPATTRFAYDGNGNLRYVVDAEGGVTEFVNDGAGQHYATGRFASVRYDKTGWPATQALDLGSIDQWKAQVDKSSVHVTSTSLDGRGNVIQEVVYGATGADGSWHTHNGYTHRYFTRDQSGQILSRVDAGKNTETFVYDGLGRVVASTDAAGATTRIAFQDAAQRTVVTLASGIVTTSTYNRAGELVAEATGGHYHAGGTASYAYDSLGRLRVKTDATGLSTAHVYDRLNRKVAELNRNGWMTEYRYDAADRLVGTVRYTHLVGGWQSDAAFDASQSPEVANLRPPAHSQDIWLWNVYDAGGRLVETIGGDGSATIFEYDASDWLVRTTAYANKLEGWRIDAFKATAPSTVQGPPPSGADSVERRFYDRAGRLVGTLDGEGRLSRTGWDAIGEKVEAVHYGNLVPEHLRSAGSFAQLVGSVGSNPADAVTRWVYDNQGHLRYEIDASGRVIEYGYEYEGWKWSAFGPVRQTIRYAGSIATLGSYTVDSMRQAIANAGLSGHGGNRTSQGVYDGADRLIYAIDAEGAVTGYRYDVMGNVVRKVDYVQRRAVGALPDEGGMHAWQSAAIGDPTNRITRNYYSASGQLRFVVDGEGFVTRNDYDAEGRLIFAVRWNEPVGATDAWTIDTVAGNVRGDWAGTTYGYNADGGLYRVTDSNGVTKEFVHWANGTLAWEITAAGLAEESRVHHLYDAAGREVTRYDAMWSGDQMATHYAYDGRGNLVTTTDAGGRTTTNGYDRAGQLVTVTDANGGVTSYGYDALGNRVRETDARGSVTWSYYDKGGRVVAVRDAENYVTETSYTVFGEVASVTRRVNQSYTVGSDFPNVQGHDADAITRFQYDKLGRATISWDAEGYAEQRWYDAFGSAVQDQNKAGGITRRVFDRRGMMIAEITPASSIDASGGTVAREASITRLDPAYYRAAYSDLAGMSDAEALSHWQQSGWRERRNPNAFFNTAYYLDANGDIAAAGINPLDHYRNDGIREGRRPAGEAASTTMVLVGSPAGRFDAAYYRAANTDLAGLDDNGLLNHWQNHGWRERRNPNASFNTRYYLDTNGDIAAAGINPLDHYRDSGIAEGRRPAPTVAEPTLTGGTVARFEYDARGNMIRRVEASGLPEQRITSYAYDKANRLVETRGDAVRWVDQGGYNVQGPTQPIERRRYDGRGNLVEITDARGARTLFFYDRLGRKTEQADALGGLVSWRYDVVGNLTHERRWALKSPNPDGIPLHPGTTAEDRVTDYTYDRLNRMTSSIVRGVRTGFWNGSTYQTGVNDVVTSYDYDAAGNVLRVVDGMGNAVYTTYDRIGRRSRQVDAEGFITAWLYDAEGNVRHERRWAARSLGYGVGWITDPSLSGEDRVTDFTHDKMGRRTSEIRRGVAAYATDGNGNLYGVSSDATVSYQYNGLGQVTRRTEATGEATIYEYDAAGRLAHETRAGYHDQDGVWTQPLLGYRYNGLGDLTRTEQTRQGGGDVRIVRYGYGAGGRLHTMTDTTGAVFTYWQDIAGAEVLQTWNRNRSDGSISHEGVMYTRDALGRVQSQATGWHNGGWNKGDVQETRYTVFGEVAQRGINGLQEDFTYDKLGNLARTNSGDGVWRYFVSDANGRRTLTLENQKRDDLAGTGIDQALHIASNWGQTSIDQAYVDGVAATMAIYDRRGQQVATKLPTRELAAGQVQTLELAAGYTPFGELAWERDATGATTHYGYNTMGRRTMVQRAAVAITDETGRTYTDTPIERFYYDAGGRLVGQDDANGRRTTRQLLAGTGYGGAEALVTAEFHPDTGVRRFGYDRFGDQRHAIDENDRKTVMQYDAAGRLVLQIRPSQQSDSYGYDVLGQRLWHANSHLGWDERETSDYDHQGRVTSTRAFGGEVTTTSYEWLGYLHTGGMGTFGGWHQSTHYANGFERVEQSDV